MKSKVVFENILLLENTDFNLEGMLNSFIVQVNGHTMYVQENFLMSAWVWFIHNLQISEFKFQSQASFDNNA